MLGSNLLGIGQKSGVYWALNPDTGIVVWQTQVGPGSGFGGIEWGTAFDGTSIYVPISNWEYLGYSLQPRGARVNGGSWAALSPSSGQVIWQTATPGACSPAVSGYAQGCWALGPASAANGVVFVGSMDVNPQNPTMFALSAATGEVLWSFVAGSSVNAAPAIASGDSIYWGSGYPHGLRQQQAVRFFDPVGRGSRRASRFSCSERAARRPSHSRRWRPSQQPGQASDEARPRRPQVRRRPRDLRRHGRKRRGPSRTVRLGVCGAVIDADQLRLRRLDRARLERR